MSRARIGPAPSSGGAGRLLFLLLVALLADVPAAAAPDAGAPETVARQARPAARRTGSGGAMPPAAAAQGTIRRATTPAARAKARPPAAVAGVKARPAAKTTRTSRRRAKPPPAPVVALPSVAVRVVTPSPAAAQVAAWVLATADNRALPYVIIDKLAARARLFDGRGRLLAEGPVLIGIAPGDTATPGVGSKRLAEIGPAEKTTPAGRFLARYGRAAGGVRVLWVDYANSVALHAIPGDASPRERRRQRMASADPAAHRITFGCINVPTAFLNRVRPLFQRRGGYVYVLPDSTPLERVFPGVVTLPWLSAAPG